MLRAAIKHGISEALSASPGFEVADFDIQQTGTLEEGIRLEIRYRYEADFRFVATFSGIDDDNEDSFGTVEIGADMPGNEQILELTHDEARAEHEIEIEVFPGELTGRDAFTVWSCDELGECIRAWTSRLDEELLALAENKVIIAQHKALAQLRKHLANVPDKRMTRQRIELYRRRLDQLETTVLALRAGDADDPEERAEEIREEFDSLRDRVAALSERSFLEAVLVRLVKYFWDDENLRIVEGASRAAEELFGDRGPQTPSTSRISEQVELTS